MAQEKLLDVAHVTRRGSSLRVTVPKLIAAELELKPEDILGFYVLDDRIIIKKVE